MKQYQFAEVILAIGESAAKPSIVVITVISLDRGIVLWAYDQMCVLAKDCGWLHVKAPEDLLLAQPNIFKAALSNIDFADPGDAEGELGPDLFWQIISKLCGDGWEPYAVVSTQTDNGISMVEHHYRRHVPEALQDSLRS